MQLPSCLDHSFSHSFQLSSHNTLECYIYSSQSHRTAHTRLARVARGSALSANIEAEACVKQACTSSHVGGCTLCSTSIARLIVATKILRNEILVPLPSSIMTQHFFRLWIEHLIIKLPVYLLIIVYFYFDCCSCFQTESRDIKRGGSDCEYASTIEVILNIWFGKHFSSSKTIFDNVLKHFLFT